MSVYACLRFILFCSFVQLALPAAGQCGTEPTTIIFFNGFNKDRVKLVADGKTVFDEVITTDDVLSAAGMFNLNRARGPQKLSLVVNGVLLHTTWLDHKHACVVAFGYSKAGYFISTESFDKAPLLY